MRLAGSSMGAIMWQYDQAEYDGKYTITENHNIISSYHIVDLKRQKRLKVGTDKPKL